MSNSTYIEMEDEKPDWWEERYKELKTKYDSLPTIRVGSQSDIDRLIAQDKQEQPEVDLEKALNSLDDADFDLGGIAVKGATYYLTVEDLKDIARHFYELGLNARKEE
jgi:hypothetical protein